VPITENHSSCVTSYFPIQNPDRVTDAPASRQGAIHPIPIPSETSRRNVDRFRLQDGAGDQSGVDGSRLPGQDVHGLFVSPVPVKRQQDDVGSGGDVMECLGSFKPGIDLVPEDFRASGRGFDADAAVEPVGGF